MDYTAINVEDLKIYLLSPENIGQNFYDQHLSSFNYIEVEETIVLDQNYQHELRFSNSKFKRVEINNGRFAENLWFKDCIFTDDFIINRGDFGWGLFFLNCQFERGLTILDIDSTSIIIENTSSVNPIKIRGANLERLVYSSINEKTIFKLEGRFTLVKSLQLLSVTGMTFFSKHCMINELKIEGYYNPSSRIDFMDIKIYDVELLNVNNDGKIYFSNFNHCFVTEVNRVPLNEITGLSLLEENHRRIQQFINTHQEIPDVVSLYSNFYFAETLKEPLYWVVYGQVINAAINPNVKPELKIQYCSLGVLELKDINLEILDIKILSTDLSSIKLINTTFPFKLHAYNKLNAYYIFNDLYSSANKQNNYRDKIEYYKTSQEALFTHLYEESFFNNISSLISIKVSNFYSNHGSNWLKSFVVTLFVIAVPLFGLFVLSLKNISMDVSKKGFRFFLEEIFPYFPQFLNPVHKIDFINTAVYPLGFWSGWIDLAGRVLIGIGLFETIRAFRKYVRS